MPRGTFPCGRARGGVVASARAIGISNTAAWLVLWTRHLQEKPRPGRGPPGGAALVRAQHLQTPDTHVGDHLLVGPGDDRDVPRTSLCRVLARGLQLQQGSGI